MILITGATGNVGSELIAALLPAQAGHIRVLTRNPGAVFPDGTQKVVADLADSDLAPVLDDVHAVFLLTDGLNIAAHDHRLIAAAQQAGVERIVKLSVLSVGHGATDLITTMHRAGEEAIRDSGIGWTFLRPTAYMSNALNWARNDRGRSGRARPVRRWPSRGRRPGGHRSGRRGQPHP